MSDFEARQVFLWVNKRDKALCVRVAELQEEDAYALKERFRGGAHMWKPTGAWQWEGQGKSALAFLDSYSGDFTIHVRRRDGVND